MINMVVVRFFSGEIIKGTTGDFSPNKSSFHLQEEGTDEMKQINVQDLKAIYFVEDLGGDSSFNENNDVERVGFGRKIKVQFKDGEIQFGYTPGYAPNRPGFFVSPCDEESNNKRIFVVTAATETVQFI